MKDTHKSAPTKTAVQIGGLIGLILLFSMPGTTLTAPELAPQVQLAHAYGNLPLRFEPSQGGRRLLRKCAFSPMAPAIACF